MKAIQENQLLKWEIKNKYVFSDCDENKHINTLIIRTNMK